MNLAMSSLDYSTAPVELRQGLSFSGGAAREAMGEIRRRYPDVRECVLLSTCNRTELYLSLAEGSDLDPRAVLCGLGGPAGERLARLTTAARDLAAARHLAEVAAGLHSQIFGEDQIIAQVKAALSAAREAGCAGAVLEKLFSTGIAAGKALRTRVRMTGVPRSSAEQAVARLTQAMGPLAGKKVLVIGNGEMGRLSARLLRQAGCAVTVTLRTYRHGETLVPAGCGVVPYEGRYGAMEGTDILVSATASPHCTVRRREFEALTHPPRWLVDLAVPRDIDGSLGKMPGMTLWDIDALGTGARPALPEEGEAILDRAVEELRQWASCREGLSAAAELKRAVAERVRARGPLSPEESAGLAVDLLTRNLKGHFSAEDLEECAEKIRARTRCRAVKAAQTGPNGFYFPLFVNLRGARAVIVGGGPVAARRAAVLARFGAQVTVVAPCLTGEFGEINHIPRPYRPGDLAGAAVVVAATGDRQVNRQVGEEARRARLPVSVADRREECTFYFPAICEGNQVVAGVVSRGDSHKDAARAAAAIRQALETWEGLE
ncbi:NAD(P)-dependent oxidoreductase [Pseudoflavonifractor sp. 524-17]|uniref:NAD(P)-dependent oxidoreductase n=1 Tax=Pseudoflavonifractor sp. 524-17 TaxID=2304577 RepID=UPI00325A867E